MAWELFAFKAYRKILVTLPKDDMSKIYFKIKQN